MIKIHQPAGKDIDISSDVYKDTAVCSSTDDFVLTVTYVLLYRFDYFNKRHLIQRSLSYYSGHGSWEVSETSP